MKILRHRTAKPPTAAPAAQAAPSVVEPLNEVKPVPTSSHIIELPSRGKFYAGNKSFITISPFITKHIYQLIGASKLKSEYEVERQVASTVNDVIADFDAFNLTTGDYEFVLYWLRLNSYVKSPYTITWEYSVEGQAEKKRVTSQIRRTDIVLNEVNPNKVPMDQMFGYATVNDKIELLKLKEEGDEARYYMARRAVHLLLNGGANRLDRKIETMFTLPPDVITDLDKHAIEFDHGVQEWVEVVDPEDKEGRKYRYELDLSVTDFFP